MSGIVHTGSRRTYAAQRGVSLGASLTLTSVSGGYQARFECVEKAARVLGTRHMQGGALLIPTDEMHKALMKLAESFSVALVDTMTDADGTRFVLVWIVKPRAVSEESTEPVTDPNQGSLNLDEY